MRPTVIAFAAFALLACAAAARAGERPRVISAFAMTRSGDNATRVIEYYGAGQGGRVERSRGAASATRS